MAYICPKTSHLNDESDQAYVLDIDESEEKSRFSVKGEGNEKTRWPPSLNNKFSLRRD